MKERLAALDIQFPDRFKNWGALSEMVRNRTAPDPHDPRPVAIVVYPTADWNGVFSGKDLGRFSKGYRLMYYEADTDIDFAAALRDGSRLGKASLLVIGGHGTQTETHFGAPDHSRPGLAERALLDTSDRMELERAGVAEAVARGANVVLESCSTGRGEGGARNVANLVAGLMPQASVWAPTRVSTAGFRFDANGLFRDVQYYSGARTYRVTPRGR